MSEQQRQLKAAVELDMVPEKFMKASRRMRPGVGCEKEMPVTVPALLCRSG
ncbi:MAG TPA: hypothetical protein VJ692_07605 [Nitrospiraceae bacterium]|nr:hypothetical protein [Nitrospiraceae bacterium]